MTSRYNLFLLALLGILLTLSLAGCGGGGASGPSYAFQDSFDSYPSANPWTLAGGWTSGQTTSWAIVPGLSGNGVQYVGSDAGFLTSSYTGTDYTVSVRARPATIVEDWEFGIYARDDGNGNRYCAVVNDSSTGSTTIGISKFYNDGASNGSPLRVFFQTTGNLDSLVYYTLTLTVSTGGSGTTVTATLTDGTITQTATWLDTGATGYGAIIPSGKAGIIVYSGPAYPVIYDNFRITMP
jgi:hypothetical protein